MFHLFGHSVNVDETALRNPYNRLFDFRCKLNSNKIDLPKNLNSITDDENNSNIINDTRNFTNNNGNDFINNNDIDDKDIDISRIVIDNNKDIDISNSNKNVDMESDTTTNSYNNSDKLNHIYNLNNKETSDIITIIPKSFSEDYPSLNEIRKKCNIKQGKIEKNISFLKFILSILIYNIINNKFLLI